VYTGVLAADYGGTIAGVAGAPAVAIVAVAAVVVVVVAVVPRGERYMPRTTWRAADWCYRQQRRMQWGRIFSIGVSTARQLAFHEQPQ
jgi:hypothetical protein